MPIDINDYLNCGHIAPVAVGQMSQAKMMVGGT